MQDHDFTRLEELLWHIVYHLNLFTKRYLAQQGLTMPRFLVLRNLSTEQPLKMSELQKRMALAPATLTGLIDGLVQGGYVERQREEIDRRSVSLRLTQQGSLLVASVNKMRESLLKNAIANAGDIDINDLNNSLEAILEHMTRISMEEF